MSLKIPKLNLKKTLNKLLLHSFHLKTYYCLSTVMIFSEISKLSSKSYNLIICDCMHSCNGYRAYYKAVL